MKFSILGCGRWGSFLAWYFKSIGCDVLLWGRENSPRLASLTATRKNEYLTLSEDVIFTSSLDTAFLFSQYLVIAIEGQNLRELMCEISKKNYLSKTYILCMKGLDNESCKRLSEVVAEFGVNNAQIAVLVGPGHPAELVHGLPTRMLVDSLNTSLKTQLAQIFSSNLIHFQVGNDLIGNEFSAAAKNIIGIAGGILDGLGYSYLKGLLMVIGTAEIAKLVNVMGGNYETAYGIACLGDYQASLFSEHSNSVNFGRAFALKQSFSKFVPGIFTAQTIAKIVEYENVYLPLCKKINSILFENGCIKDIISVLLETTYN